MVIREQKDQLELMNFKIPSKTKKRFQEICKSRNRQMTSVMNQFIIEFIRSNKDLIDNDDLTLPLDFFATEL